jgi:hypothetical protein
MYHHISTLTINGLTVKKPTEQGYERYNLTKSGRVASGKMTMELVAKKRKFTFSYDCISGPDLDIILTAIDSDAMFFPLQYEENNIVKTCTVYAGGIKYKKYRTDGIWYWKDLTFDLIEQ